MQSSSSSQGSVSIQSYDASRAKDWDGYINKSSLSTLGHHLGWKSVIEDTFGNQSFYLMAYIGNNVAGVLPLFLFDSWIFGRFLVTTPFLTYGGILYDDENVGLSLINHARELAKDMNVKYVEYRNIQHCKFSQDTKTKYYTLILDLADGEESIWSNKLHTTARRNVRKAIKQNLKIVEDKNLIGEYYKINAINMRRLGTPAHGLQFFTNILKHLPDTILLMVEFDNKYIGGMLLPRYKDTFHMPWVASDPNYLQMRPNNLLYWEAIKQACNAGMHYLDFGRSKTGSGTYDFKMQHGALPTQLYYQYYLNKSNEMPEIDPDASSFRTLVRIWQTLPLSFINIVSPHIIKNIP